MTWQEVGDGVFRRRYPSFDLNCGVVVGSGACLLIDTRSHLGEATQLRTDLSRLTRARLTAVVNTHAHFDHCFGNAAFGGVPVWGHRSCADALERHGELQRKLMATQCREHGSEDFAAHLEEAPIVAPQRLVDGEATIGVGDRLVRLRHLGRGHTDNDLVVEVPDAGVLFAGDLVEEGGEPAMEDAWPLEWPATLARLSAIARGPVVPGHGDVVDAAFVTAQRDDLTTVAELARQVCDGVLDEASAVRRSPLGPHTTRTAIARCRRPDSPARPV